MNAFTYEARFQEEQLTGKKIYLFTYIVQYALTTMYMKIENQHNQNKEKVHYGTSTVV